jgi:hypothetical protein
MLYFEVNDSVRRSQTQTFAFVATTVRNKKIEREDVEL